MFRCFLLFFIVSILPACSGMQMKEKFSKFDSSLNRYSASIRWARYIDAYDFHVGKDGKKPELKIEQYDGIRVTSYDIVEKTANEAMDEILILAVISYYNDNVGTVNQYKHFQTWWYNEERKTWLLDAELPDMK